MIKTEIKKAKDEIQSVYNLSKGRMNVFEMAEAFDLGSAGSARRKVQFGVNWAAIGTVTPIEAEKFAELLRKVAKIAKKWSGKFTRLEWSGY